VVFASLAHAQESTIVGAVTDPTGAAVANAAITLTNIETGQARQLVSNEVGQFVAPNLRFGHYSLKIEAKGFKTVEQKNIVLAVGDRARFDFKLELGTATEKVTVEATQVAIQTESGETSHVITDEQVAQIPANGRSIYAMVALIPGASSNMADAQVPTPVGGDATVSFNGLRQGHNLYMLDGGENLDRGGSGTFSVMPSVDAIQEFRALTSNYSSEYGLASGGTMTMVLKSGTKQFHGGAWEYLRNDALDAIPYFHSATVPKPELRFNVFGFNVGGPVIFKKTENPNTFFFYNMEWRKQVQGGNVNQVVPDASTYTGVLKTAIHVPDFAKLSPAQQAKFTALGLTSGQAFANNTIPTALLDANAQSLLKAGIFPANNGTDANGHPVFQGGNKQPTNVREEIVRIDHRFNDKFSIFGHWINESIMQTFGTSMWSGDNVPTVGNTFGNPSYSGVVHATHIISPTLLNEVALNYNGNRINIIPAGTFAAPSDFKFNRVFSGENASNRIPSINLGGSTGTNYTVNWMPWTNKADDYQIRDDISWTKGSHQFKFGASWAIYKKIQDLFAPTQGGFTFNGSYTGNDFADFLLGYANAYNENALQDHGYWNNVSWAAYAQDNWRVNNRLTLNLGLRWDGVPHTYEAKNRMSNFYPDMYDASKAAVLAADNNSIAANSPGLGSSPNSILAGIPFYLNGVGISGQPGVPKGMTKDQWLGLGPRIGFAYDLTGKGNTVLRGGFGMTFERIQGNDMYNGGANSPFSALVNYSDVSLSNPKTSVLTGNTMSAPIPIVAITGISKDDYKLPTVYEYSFGVQQNLGKSILDITYVGNQQRHQNFWREINLPANPTAALLAQLANGQISGGINSLVPYKGFGSIRLATNGGSGHYNGLQIGLRGDLKGDLSYQLAYTYSHAIDSTLGSGGNGIDLNNLSNPYDQRYDVGPSNLDRTQIFVANYIYKLPFLKNSPNHVAKTMLGGWQVSGVVTAQSGVPLNITLGGTYGGNGLPNASNRPDLKGSISYPQKVSAWFNASALAQPAAGAWGNLGNHAVRGPGRDNWNLALIKNFMFNEERGSNLEFRAEFFNVWNHTQFNAVSSTFSNSNFGQVTSAYNPRNLQLGLKLHF
jgi:hypothetical protein